MLVEAFRSEWLQDLYFKQCQWGVRKLAMDDYQEGNLPDAVKERLLAQLPEYLRDADLDELFSNPDMRYRLCQNLLSFGGQDFLALDLLSQPWIIPSQHEIDHFWNILKPVLEKWGSPNLFYDGRKSEVLQVLDQFFAGSRDSQARNPFKYRFSATAAAISFLHSLAPSTRLHMRRLVLDENTESVTYPERHGKGLVEFCHENPRLRVERRVSLWKTVLPQMTRSGRSSGCQDCGETWLGPSSSSRQRGDYWSRPGSSWWTQPPEPAYPGSYPPPPAFGLSGAIASWALEALSLPKNVTLVIDGGPLPQLSAQIFQDIVVLDAVWQAACEKAFASEHYRLYNSEWVFNSSAYQDHGDHGGYICEDFPNIVRAILDGSGPISLNFPIGGAASFEQQVEDMLFGRREWEARDWYRAWEERHRDKSVKPDPPLAADWAGLFQLDMLPRADDPTDAAGQITGS
ncbi:hypothetical protein QBC37DRAFT_391234 [Rhypophila decipiens]|uniref:Uncharacterized protein n=1 Tax=Rhypophila decipiens TaxID=261697 RepID=A0AAN6XYY6_9PEZI|nr:hypothetical protein QBC37DRAFT_391234 [Rhypophila decipiens]